MYGMDGLSAEYCVVVCIIGSVKRCPSQSAYNILTLHSSYYVENSVTWESSHVDVHNVVTQKQEYLRFYICLL